jgi:hypothetical protein
MSRKIADVASSLHYYERQTQTNKKPNERRPVGFLLTQGFRVFADGVLKSLSLPLLTPG